MVSDNLKILNENSPHDAGDTIIIEQEVYLKKPFEDDESLIDADSIDITIISPDGTKLVDGESMSKNATGKYYYIWNTSDDITEGDHQVIITANRNSETGTEDDGYIRIA